MSEEILINVTPRETRVAVVENGMLQELHIERASKRGYVGNIYKGRVQRVMPGMQAAFVEIGLQRAAFLHASDIVRPLQGLNADGDDTNLPTPPIHELVREGQDVVVKIESFPYTRYGMLTGRVVHVSHDAQQHEQLGLVFQARVQLEHNQIEVEGMPIRLSPGMTLSVEIKTGKRRVIDYLLSPLKQYSGEAMRER